MFFSDSDDKGLIGKNARRMIVCLSIPIDEDLHFLLLDRVISTYSFIASRCTLEGYGRTSQKFWSPYTMYG